MKTTPVHVGATSRWHTRTIVNVSVLGKVFNQYPTRRLVR